MHSRVRPRTEDGWFELLLHEASHHLIQSSSGFVGGTIENVRSVMQRKAPRQLWHACLFYFSGRVAQNLLLESGRSDYALYMVRNNVFSFVFPQIDKHLPAYMANEITFAEAVKRVLEDFEPTQ